MNAKDTFLSVSEVGNLLGRSKQAILKAIAASKYVIREVPATGKGGGKGGMKYEIALSSLPQEAQLRYWGERTQHQVLTDSKPVRSEASPAVIPPAGTLSPRASQGAGLLSPEKLDETQRLREHARKLLVGYVDEYPESRAKAVEYLNRAYADHTLDPRIRAAMDHANDRANESRRGRLLLATVDVWKRNLKRRGTVAPLKARLPNTGVLPWHAEAIALKKRPQGITLTAIQEELAKRFEPPPTYDQICRFFREKFSAGEQLEGRWTGMQLRAKQRYQARKTDHLEPWHELHADGWTTHFTAPHPVTGEYVTYELWDVHDLATRYVPPMSVGMRENFEVIFQAIENAVRFGGVPAILQTDSTKIVKAGERFKNNPATALQDRLGMTIVHPRVVGNAQANGIAENFHTYLDREARLLATYQHERMDRMSYKRIQKMTKALTQARNSGDLDAIERATRALDRANMGLLLNSLDDVLAWVEAVRVKWNNHPCRELKKVRGADGKLRHQTPQEALDEHRANGWEGVILDDKTMADLFRPHVQVTVRRGTVKPYGGMRFYHPDLWHYEGKPVVVAYSIDDWRHVTVKDLKGATLCVADFDEARDGRALSFREDAEAKRAEARIKRLEKKAETIRAQTPGVLLEQDPPAGRVLTIADFLPAEPEALPVAPEKTILDFLPASDEDGNEGPSYMDTMMMLYGDKDEDEPKDEEGAAR